MKLSLKLYRKLFRLFCLKRFERERIEKMYQAQLSLRTKNMYDEYVLAYHELTQWQAVARMYRIHNPYDLYKMLEDLHLQPADYLTEANLKAMEVQCAAELSERSKLNEKRKD